MTHVKSDPPHCAPRPVVRARAWFTIAGCRWQHCRRIGGLDMTGMKGMGDLTLQSNAPLPAPLRASLDRLFEQARQARERAHAPYSGFAVGAAVLDAEGRVHAGCNVENAAYPQGWCAEATALGAMVMAGGRAVQAVLVLADGPGLVTPCGGCRQKLREFAGPQALILAADLVGVRQVWTLEELLPHSFGPSHLGFGA